ncbi:MAG TPA: GIY-YIG nuclease family protein [Myxococcales bacterium]|jgi:predicted GIY-YIG superfamily endonuclease
MTFWVYILQLADGTFYTGQTDDLERRLAQHDVGEGSFYAAKRHSVRCVWSQEFPTRQDAFERERQIKNWSHAKKVALITGNWEELKRLSKGKNQNGTRD